MEIHWIPIEVVQVWRVLVWAAGLVLLGSVVAFLPRAWRHRNREELMPRWTLDLYTAMAIFVAQGCYAQAYRWDQPMTLHGLPVTTIAIVFCLLARARRFRDRI